MKPQSKVEHSTTEPLHAPPDVYQNGFKDIHRPRGRSHFTSQGHNLNKLSGNLLGNATY